MFRVIVCVWMGEFIELKCFESKVMVWVEENIVEFYKVYMMGLFVIYVYIFVINIWFMIGGMFFFFIFVLLMLIVIL